MAVNPTECWNFVEAPNQLVVKSYPDKANHDGSTYHVVKLDIAKYHNTIIVLSEPEGYQADYGVGLVLKYNANYVPGTACDIVMPTGMQLQGGAVLFETPSGSLERLRSAYPYMDQNGYYYFDSGEAIRVTLFTDQWSNKYYWQLSELIYRQY